MSGIIHSHGVIRSAGIIRRQGIISRLGVIRGGGGDDDDPLADIDFILRLQTHRGDGVPLGLYQDTACTIPAVNDGDSVAAWRDEMSGSGLIAIQTVSTKRPALRVVAGKPVLQYDGVDDWLDVGPMGGQVLYTAGIRSTAPYWTTYFGVIDKSSDTDGTNRWALFWEGRDEFLDTDNPPLARVNGAEAPLSDGGRYRVPNADTWNTLTVLTKPASSVNRGLMQFGGSFYGAGYLTSLMVMPSDTAEADYQRVETYVTTLHP